jgi:hypothetical protein
MAHSLNGKICRRAKHTASGAKGKGEREKGEEGKRGRGKGDGFM